MLKSTAKLTISRDACITIAPGLSLMALSKHKLISSSQSNSQKEKIPKMAQNRDNNKYDSYEESNPLLNKKLEQEAENEKKSNVDCKTKTVVASLKTPPSAKPVALGSGDYGWIANGMLMGHGSVMGGPMGRTQWASSLLACFGRNDEFCSSNVEIVEPEGDEDLGFEGLRLKKRSVLVMSEMFLRSIHFALKHRTLCLCNSLTRSNTKNPNRSFNLVLSLSRSLSLNNLGGFLFFSFSREENVGTTVWDRRTRFNRVLLIRKNSYPWYNRKYTQQSVLFHGVVKKEKMDIMWKLQITPLEIIFGTFFVVAV